MTKEEKLEIENSKLKIKVEDLYIINLMLREENQNKTNITNIYNYIAAILGYVFVDVLSPNLDVQGKILVCLFVVMCLTALILLKRGKKDDN